MKSNIDNSNFTNFLQAGAILQLGVDQFKLIWGPFTQINLNITVVSDEKTIIYVPNFWDFASAKASLCLIGSNECVVSGVQLQQILGKLPVSRPEVAWNEVSEVTFKEQFDWSFDKFNTGELLKTVPIIKQQGRISFTPENLTYILLNLIRENYYGTTYGFWYDNQGFLGHTPEKILDWQHSNSCLQTMAVAGTQESKATKATKSNSEEKNLFINNKKIDNEHNLVVEDLKTLFSRYFPDKNLEIGKTSVLELKHLCHLLTPMSLNDINLNEALQILNVIHPTAALGIYPRVSALYNVFKGLELQKIRRNFGAPFGFINKKSVFIVAAIRNFYFSNAELILFSGCGITQDSQFQDEVSELQKKRNSVKLMMGLNL